MDCSLSGLCPWGSPVKNTGVDCHFLLQGIFLTQGSNSHLLHCRQILYHLSYREVHNYRILQARILEYPTTRLKGVLIPGHWVEYSEGSCLSGVK